MEQFQVTLRITDFCNKSCDYCHWNKGIHYEKENIFKIIDKMILFLKIKNKKPLFYFHGGEPTTHPHFEEIVNYIISKKIYVEIQTNLTNFKKIELFINNEYVQFSTSVHFEFLDIEEIQKIKEFLSKYIDKINFIDIMYSDKTADLVYDFRQTFGEKTSITHNYYKGTNYKISAKFNLNDYEKNKNDVFAGKSFEGEYCELNNYLIINGDGNIYKCSTPMTEKHKTFNIFDKDWSTKINNLLGIKLCLYKICGSEKDNYK